MEQPQARLQSVARAEERAVTGEELRKVYDAHLRDDEDGGHTAALLAVQDAVKRECAKAMCQYCEAGFPQESGPGWHDIAGHIFVCKAAAILDEQEAP